VTQASRTPSYREHHGSQCQVSRLSRPWQQSFLPFTVARSCSSTSEQSADRLVNPGKSSKRTSYKSHWRQEEKRSLYVMSLYGLHVRHTLTSYIYLQHYYDQNMRQYGDIMRVGDVVAHERLQHITIIMQGEVIKSLQSAARNEIAVLNLTLLHEASIINRKETIMTLDQLKQRLLIRMPISQLNGLSDKSLTDWSGRLHSASPEAAMQSRPPIAPAHREYSQAFQRAMDLRGITDPRAMNAEIDEIMDAYQGLQVSGSWNRYQHGAGRAPQGMVNVRFPPSPDPSSSARDYSPVTNNLPPTPEEFGTREHIQQPVFDNGVFGQQYEAQSRQQQPAQNPQIQMQSHANQVRWSTESGSTHSGPPSVDRNSSTSSQDSRTKPNPPPLSHFRNMRTASSPNEQYQYYDGLHPVQSPHETTNAPTERHSVAPLSPQDTRGHYASPSPIESFNNPASSSPHSFIYQHTSYPQPPSYSTSASFAPSHQQYSIAPDHDLDSGMQNRHQYHLWPAVARVPSGTQSTANLIASDHTVAQHAAAPVPETASTIASLHRASVAPSVASTDSSASTPVKGILPGRGMRNSIRTDTIRANTDSEKMMNGRACKANNYWGFCKGAWSIREDQKKGLSLHIQPSGMYNTREIWECRCCSFKGTTFSAAHPTKSDKKITIVDPRIHTSPSGVRYKWICKLPTTLQQHMLIFDVVLAKAHVKKKSTDVSPESNYGCIICSLEDKVSSVYGGVDSLMNHIALSHASLSDSTRRKAKCIIGRTAGLDEYGWDINIPVFAQVEELN